ncbi:MAG TPA: M28 family metallopeptidase [Candidatus Acidoferrales bacterium]|nr:M28 family metallopeptidase [Candidatus Acidoferrales bacterium]
MLNRTYAHCTFLLAAILVIAALPPSLASRRRAKQDLRGFLASHASAERKLEDRFQAIPDSTHVEADLRYLTSQPHLAGTEASHRVAEWLCDQYKSFGFDAQIVTYSAWIPLPRELKVELVAPGRRELGSRERAYSEDKDTSNPDVPVGFNSYSPSGDVTAPVVYANYGTEQDYRALKSLGVSVEGKILLVRYGRVYRGIKAKLAEEHKAAGLLLFSDPADDGYVVGDPYPRGPWRPLSGIQRGSILYTQFYPGDPLTPGVAATANAKRIAPAAASNLPQIMTASINAQDASAILADLGGEQVSRDWQGGLPVTYHVGPGEAQIHLKISMNYQQRSIYDVIAKLHGTDDNSWVILGNHHDAWVFGAADPGSGTTAMLEAARALGNLARSGWTPRRTIVICEWDAEEPGLIGSTEWVEDNLTALQKKAVAYINTDVGVTGTKFNAAATPSLNQLVREVIQDVKDPNSGQSIYDVWRGRSSELDQVREPQQKPDEVASPTLSTSPSGNLPLAALGAGSDFCPFFDHAGIPSMDVSFTGPYGVYHSMYDDFYWMKHFGDPRFEYEAALARVLGVLALRLDNADILPLDYRDYAADITDASDALSATGNLGQIGPNPPDREQDAPSLSHAAAKFANAATLAAQALQSIHSGTLTADQQAAINRALVDVEQAFLSANGLPGRPWYKHTIFAPGSDAGYAAEIFPGVTESMNSDPAIFTAQMEVLEDALRRATAELDDVTRLAAAPN